ncbi:hypothetical protein [Nostoc sp. 106C]|nr:hypothetical protein [Nostoc sp. 106C]
MASQTDALTLQADVLASQTDALTLQDVAFYGFYPIKQRFKVDG